MGGHGEEVHDLLSLQPERKPDGEGFQFLKTGKIRCGILFSVDQPVVDNGFKAREMVFCSQHLEEIALGF